MAVALLVAALLVGAVPPAVAGPTPSRPASARASTPVLIERARAQGEISRFRADLYLAYALVHPERLPDAFRSEAPWRGTIPLLHLRERIAGMASGPRRTRLKEALVGAPPHKCSTNNAPSNTLTTTHFLVEYPSTIGAGLSITDYTTSLETAWTKEVTSFGWAAPPLHPSAGGRYHVIITDLSPTLYGFVSTSGTFAGIAGDNPNTPSWTEPDAYATCMVLNSDYSGFPSPPQASLDSTTGHEFNHSLQFGYGAITGANEPDLSFVEGGATWMEDEVFDGANDNYNYLWPEFDRDMGNYGASPYPYWITFRGLTERYGTGIAGGGEQVMQDFWEAVGKNSHLGLDAMNHALQNRSTNLADAYHAYAIAVKFSKACGGGYALPYCFEEGSGYVAARGLPPIARQGGTIATVGGSFSGSIPDNYALNWVALPTSGAYGVVLNNTSAGGQLRGTITCDTGTTLVRTPMPAIVGGGTSTMLSSFDPTGCTSVVAVITNQSQTSTDPTTSTARSFTLSTGHPPSAPSLSALGTFRTTRSIPLKWTASTDPETDVVSYRLQRRVAPPGQPLGQWQDGGTTTSTSATVQGQPGYTYCFRVRAINSVDLASDLSNVRCTSLPLNDRSLTAIGKWSRRTGSGYYLNTYTRGSSNGATLEKAVTARRLALIATRCPGCGTVKIFFRDKLLGKISLNAGSTRKRRIISIASFSRRRSGTVKIKIVSRSKPVLIEGLGASAI